MTLRRDWLEVNNEDILTLTMSQNQFVLRISGNVSVKPFAEVYGFFN